MNIVFGLLFIGAASLAYFKRQPPPPLVPPRCEAELVEHKPHLRSRKYLIACEGGAYLTAAEGGFAALVEPDTIPVLPETDQ